MLPTNMAVRRQRSTPNPQCCAFAHNAYRAHLKAWGRLGTSPARQSHVPLHNGERLRCGVLPGAPAPPPGQWGGEGGGGTTARSWTNPIPTLTDHHPRTPPADPSGRHLGNCIPGHAGCECACLRGHSDCTIGVPPPDGRKHQRQHQPPACQRGLFQIA